MLFVVSDWGCNLPRTSDPSGPVNVYPTYYMEHGFLFVFINVFILFFLSFDPDLMTLFGDKYLFLTLGVLVFKYGFYFAVRESLKFSD